MPSLPLFALLVLLTPTAFSHPGGRPPPDVPDPSYAPDSSDSNAPPSFTSCYVVAEAWDSASGRPAASSDYVYAEIAVADKTTPERGRPGQGLLDNLKHECGGVLSGPDNLDGSGKNPVTGQLQWYDMRLTLSRAADGSCVARAILKAENQTVTCTGDWAGYGNR